MAERGHYLPDWDYRRGRFGEIEVRRSSPYHDAGFVRPHNGAPNLERDSEDFFADRLKDREWQLGDATGPMSIYGGELAVLANELLMNGLQNELITLKALVTSEICVRLDYCDWSKRLNTFDAGTWAVLVGFVEWLVKDQLKVAFPPVALAVFMVKRHVLDEWCGCPPVTEQSPAPATT